MGRSRKPLSAQAFREFESLSAIRFFDGKITAAGAAVFRFWIFSAAAVRAQTRKPPVTREPASARMQIKFFLPVKH